MSYAVLLAGFKLLAGALGGASAALRVGVNGRGARLDHLERSATDDPPRLGGGAESVASPAA